MNHHRLTATALGLSFTAMALLGACSKSDDPTPAQGSTTTKPAEAAAEGEIPKLKDAKGAFRALKVANCEKGPGKVAADGTIKNSASKTRDLVISVSWVDPKGNGVLDRDVAIVEDLGAGRSAEWKLSGEVPAKIKATCAFTVKSGSLP